jgi:hypothetical protein
MGSSVITVGIGGPGTILPSWVESVLCWTLCVSCLSVSGYYWTLTTIIRPMVMKIRYHFWIRCRTFLYPTQKHHDDIEVQFRSKPFIPLTTASRREIAHKTTKDRFKQLISFCRRRKIPLHATTSDSDLVYLFRSNDTCRRLASLMMRPSTTSDLLLLQQCQYSEEEDELMSALPKRLAALWPQLLSLPSIGIYHPSCTSSQTTDSVDALDNQTPRFEFLISVILPAFRENGIEIQRRLQTMCESCTHPMSVELILVDAGGCYQLNDESIFSDNLTTAKHRWGKATLLHFTEGGGRGPCLNYGAMAACGQILTFLHSDTILPPAWDQSIVNAFQHLHTTKSAVWTNSCAFAFGTYTNLVESPLPPGIEAVHTTANVRSRLFSLPYGDQCISIPNTFFHLVGGFPDQCLMEDYELMCLLRMRSSSSSAMNHRKEKIIILKGEPARCSSRRWQAFGVLYVTYRNSKLVNLYASGLCPEDLYEKYYGEKPPKRKVECSPWELELENNINDKKEN